MFNCMMKLELYFSNTFCCIVFGLNFVIKTKQGFQKSSTHYPIIMTEYFRKIILKTAFENHCILCEVQNVQIDQGKQ